MDEGNSLEKKRKHRVEEYFENMEIELVGLSEKETSRRICAVIRALLEIDEIAGPKESETKEAA